MWILEFIEDESPRVAVAATTDCKKEMLGCGLLEKKIGAREIGRGIKKMKSTEPVQQRP